jgi:hypothetical protein
MLWLIGLVSTSVRETLLSVLMVFPSSSKTMMSISTTGKLCMKGVPLALGIRPIGMAGDAGTLSEKFENGVLGGLV